MRPQGREHPWNVRRITHRHLHDQLNLLDLRLLTEAWTAKPSDKGSEEGATDEDEALRRHESAFSLDDDTSPEDALTRSESEIRSEQLRALEGLLQQGPRLAELSFQAGQESAARRWMDGGSDAGSIAPADKRALLLALFHSPLAGRLGPDAFLIRRKLITEVSVELLNCPHCPQPGVLAPQAIPQQIQDELCRQQFSWLKGYFNFLNPAIQPSHSRPRGRCVVSW